MLLDAPELLLASIHSRPVGALPFATRLPFVAVGAKRPEVIGGMIITRLSVINLQSHSRFPRTLSTSGAVSAFDIAPRAAVLISAENFSPNLLPITR